MASILGYLSRSSVMISFSRLNITKRCTTALCLISALTLLSAQALAADTIIGFDDQSSGTPISSQYQGLGLTLDTVRGSGAGSFPIATASPDAHSPGNALDISRNFPVEFPGAYLQGTFTNPHHAKVGLWIQGRGIPGGPKTGTTTLQAFNLSGTVVATSTAIAPPPGGGFVFLQADAPASDIARFEVTCSNDLLFADDITFDPLSNTPAPDFAVIASRVVLPVGGSGSTSVILRRFAGSTGDVAYSVADLPPGVSVTGAQPNPMSGPDGSVSVLTLTADNTASPVQDRSLRLTGFPAATAGQFGPHTSSFPLTILDSYDAQVVGIEVTQSVQFFDLPKGSVANQPLHGSPVRYVGSPLAAGGKTIVRVFPNLALFPGNSPVPEFVCVLAATRDGAPLSGSPMATGPGLNPLILGLNFVDDTARAGHAKECDFILPSEWTAGTINLNASINPLPQFGPPVSLECCLDNNSFTLTDIAFTPTRELVFAPFSMRVNQGALGFPDDVFAEAQNLLPIGSNQFNMGDYVGNIDITDIWNQQMKACGFLGFDFCPEDATGRGASVTARLRDIADELNFTESGELVVGIYPQSDPTTNTSDQIRSLTSSDCTGPFWDCDALQVIAVQNALRPLTSVAHELGHKMGRNHASFACGAGDVDNNGPAENWPPDERGLLQGVGVDRRSLRVLFPDRTGGRLGGPFYDYMSYCANGSNSNDPDAWISVRGWQEMIQAVATGAPGTQALRVASARQRPARPSVPTLIVQAFIDLKDNVSVSRIALEPRPPKTPPAASPFELVAFGRSGSIVASQKMATTEGIGHHLQGKVIFLSASVPVDEVDAVEIHKNGKPIARRERSKEIPMVHDVDVDSKDMYSCKVLQRSDSDCGGDSDDRSATVVTWKTFYHGKQPLTAKLDYSTDAGETWKPVFYGPDHGRAMLKDVALPPSEVARFRVRVSDGFNQATALSRISEQRAGRPVVRILSPAPGAEAQAGQLIYLSGKAYDSSRQSIPGTHMIWFAGDQKLGVGQTLIVPSLPSGDNVIRLVVDDDDNQATEQRVQLRIRDRTR